MKKSTLKNAAIVVITSALLLALIIGGIFIKYRIWRDEHPQAKTYTFFLSRD